MEILLAVLFTFPIFLLTLINIGVINDLDYYDCIRYSLIYYLIYGSVLLILVISGVLK